MRVFKAIKPSKKTLAKVHALRAKKGVIAVIEPESGDYLLGDTLTEVLKKAKEKYSGKIFYSVRAGSSFGHEPKGWFAIDS